jgi:hypothetical protein
VVKRLLHGVEIMKENKDFSIEEQLEYGKKI